jgi:hypothetical protein
VEIALKKVRDYWQSLRVRKVPRLFPGPVGLMPS